MKLELVVGDICGSVSSKFYFKLGLSWLSACEVYAYMELYEEGGPGAVLQAQQMTS